MDAFLARNARLSPLVLHGGPVLIFLLLVLALWQVDRYAVRTQMDVHQKEAGVLSGQLAGHLESIFQTRFQIVNHLAFEWDHQIGGHREAFFDEAQQMHDMFSGFQAINWVDRDGTIRWVTPADTNPGLEGKSILAVKAAAPVFRTVARTFIPHVTPPVPLLQGYVGIVGYFPVTKAGRFDGVVTAVFKPAQIIEEALAGTFRDHYHIQVKGGGTVIYDSAGDVDGAPFTVEHPIRVWDQQWTVKIMPTLAAEHVDGLSAQVKAVILALSVVVSGLVWLYLKRLSDLILANNAKSEFLANMSHELRTPLNSVIGYGEMMEYEILGPMPGPYKEYSSLITSSGRLLLESISSILDIAKIEAGKFELEKSPTDMHAIVAEVVTILAIQAQQKGLELRDETQDLPHLNVDPLRVKQVLLNVVGNAIKFTNKGSVTIRNMNRGMEAVIAVTDTGIGMTAEQVAVALQPFRQVHGTSQARRYQGTGLGLSLSRQVMDLHGGRLHVASWPGQGTTVEIAFPVDGG